MVDLRRVLRITRTAYVGDQHVPWVYLPTNRLQELVTTTVFSPPAEVLEADAGGSTGHSRSENLDWGPDVGEIRHVFSERDHYHKRYINHNIVPSGGEPPIKVRELLMRLRDNHVARPVVRSIRIRRDGIDMQWAAIRHPRNQVVISADANVPAVQELSSTAITLDLVQASEFNLDAEIYEETIANAHDEGFIEEKVWPSLSSVRGNPVVSIREQISTQPAEIPDAKYLQTWIIDRQDQGGGARAGGSGGGPNDDGGDDRDDWTIRSV